MTLLIDFDSTLVTCESLSILLGRAAESVEIAEKIQAITQQGNRGQITMLQSYQKRLELANPSVKLFNEFMEELKTKVTPGFEECLKKVRQDFPKVQIIIVSHGPKCCITPIAKDLNISQENVYAVNLDIEAKDGKYVTEEDLITKGKQKIMGDLKDNGSIVSPIICIGDGVSDMKIKTTGVADFSIGFGVNNYLEQTKEMSDFYVTDMIEFEKVLFDILKK
eukprot:gene8935-884_t